MAVEGKPCSVDGNAGKNKKRKHYLPFNKPVKRGPNPLRSGVQGFFITCDGGRERQAANEAIRVMETLYEDMVEGNTSKVCFKSLQNKPVNKKIKFVCSDSSSGDEEPKQKDEVPVGESGCDYIKPGQYGHEEECIIDPFKKDNFQNCNNGIEKNEDRCEAANINAAIDQENETVVPPKNKCKITSTPNADKIALEKKSIDRLIEAEIQELGDPCKRRFNGLESGCNGVIFIQMQRTHGDPSPREIVHRLMSSAASTKKQISRFILRILPVEVACYASEDDIKRSMEPIVNRYFSSDANDMQKFAVIYDARANTGVERMKIIDAVAKSIPGPHKVDLNNPDQTIMVQVVKTVCLIGVVEKYKQLAKYNLRQLTSTTTAP